tara:strand:- start:214 stop:1848 length:1635 start_codon:yes stop_codon:yes gene_type:complete
MATTNVDSKVKRPDFASPNFDGDFRLLELTLHSPNNRDVVQLNSSSVFQKMEIFEDLFSNVIRGTLTILDSQGLAELFPFVGEETLIMTFFTPGGEGTSLQRNRTSRTSVEEMNRQRFKVYDIVEVGTQERTKFYKMFFVSEEYVFNMKQKVSKGYKGREFSFIVKDLMAKLNRNIKTDLRKEVFIEKTLSTQNVIVPNWTPFQAINFCASRSLSSDIESQEQTDTTTSPPPPRPVGSLFVFYEKFGAGFFYESIESLIIKQKMVGDLPIYQYAPKLTESKSGNLSVGYFHVEQFEVETSFKTLENLGYGMFASKLIAYDPLRMKYDTVKYDYYEKSTNEVSQRDDRTGVEEITTQPENLTDDSSRVFGDFIATDINPIDRKSNKFVSSDSEFLGSNDASIKLATTTRNHGELFLPSANGSSIGVKSDTFRDPESKQNNVEDWLLQREAQLQEFGSIVVKFTVPGNTSRHVGDLIRFEMPTSIPDDDPNISSLEIGHQLYSGNYIVSKIRHVITVDSYDMDMEIIKNSFAKRIGGQITETRDAN